MRVWRAAHTAIVRHCRNFNSHTREGVTNILIFGGNIRWNFNSHTREGVTSVEADTALSMTISTHTPVRVWLCFTFTTSCKANFNSHTREGVTSEFTHLWLSTPQFQLTHPWGCDAMTLSALPISSIISTHTPVRVWLVYSIIFWDYERISTHTPVRVWLSLSERLSFSLIFQLTHPWGCDGFCMDMVTPVLKFQLTHPWGCDYFSPNNVTESWGFQLTHPWGCDSWRSYLC